MKHLKHFSSLNEEVFQGIEVLPKEVIWIRNVCWLQKSKNKVEVYPDPKVEGTYAVRVYRTDLTFDLLWYKGGAFYFF